MRQTSDRGGQGERVHNAFVITGPTAVGKTRIAIRVAERIHAEILSVDAMQIYRGLETLTAAPTSTERARIRHHLIGVLPLTERCDAVRYHSLSRTVLEEHSTRTRPALVVGGSGLYLRVLANGLDPSPPPDMDLRAELSKLSLAALQARLRRMNPATFAALADPQNPRRLIRAIEKLEGPRDAGGALYPLIAQRGVCLVQRREVLVERIRDRVVQMLDHGAIEEVQRIEAISPTARATIGFEEIRSYLAGELTRAELIDRIEIATRQYAKRQLTWLRRETWLEMIDMNTLDEDAVVDRIVAAMSKHSS